MLFRSFQLTVVEEVIEGPQAAVFGKRIRRQIGTEGVDVAILQVDLLVQGTPKLVSYFGVMIHGRDGQQIVHTIDDGLELMIK